MKNKLSPEDQALFKRAMRDVKKLAQSKINLPARPALKKTSKPSQVMSKAAVNDFSDQEYLDAVSGEDSLYYAHPSLPPRALRSLRRGEYKIQAVLDLHGMIVDDARTTLHEFLLDCVEEKKNHVLIIHGKGRGNLKAILKNKLNHWLRQTKQVLAFCSATPKDGGTGAVYVYLKRDKSS